MVFYVPLQRGMLTTTPAIVLHTTRYGDSRLLTLMFTRDYGVLTFSSSSLSRHRGRASSAGYLSPLSLVNVSFDHHPLSAVQRTTVCRRTTPLAAISCDAVKTAQCLFLADVLRRVLHSEQRNVPLYEYLAASVLWLDAAHDGYANFHIVFLVGLTRYLGICPNLRHYRAGALFALSEGTYVAAVPPHDNSTGTYGDALLSPEETALIPLLLRLTYRTMRLLRLSRHDRNRCVERLLAYYSYHLPNSLSPRSFDVLKELFV